MERLFEITSHASSIVYHVEAMDKIKIPKAMIREYINLQKTVGSFPGELNYVTSFYDAKTGSSGTLFENTNEGNYILSYTGTNFYFDRQKDMYADVVGICLGQAEHMTSCYRFYTRMKKKYGNDIILTGHSLGGSIAQRVAIEYDIFTRISELLSIGYYVGDEIIVKEAGMHGIKSFLDVYRKSFAGSFEKRDNDELLSLEYKDFSLAEIGILSNFSEERIEGLENQLNALLVSDTVIDNLNKNPYNVNFEFFIKAILDNIAKKKEEL